VRFETKPGQQGQFGWSEYRVPIDKSITKIFLFDLTLSYSRRKFLFVSYDATQSSVFEALEESIWSCGRAPKRLLVDNHRTMVDDPRPKYFKWNKEFVSLCGYYAIEPIACLPRRSQTKNQLHAFQEGLRQKGKLKTLLGS